MNILIAPDKFKGTLTAKDVCDAVAEGIKTKFPDYQCSYAPLADGGEGTFEILLDHFRGSIKTIEVDDPLFRKVHAQYGLSADGNIAIIEMAKASGLALLTAAERNPMFTSSIGTGQLIADAIDSGATHIILGIGGSATNDAGIGMAVALGAIFFDDAKKRITPIGKNLIEINRMELQPLRNHLQHIQFTVLCDVQNPLHGPEGAAHIYAKQKGASSAEIEKLDRGLQHFATHCKETFNIDLNFPGAGAAGGMGAGARLFLDAHFKSGIAYISELVGLEEKIASADLVITGEGKLDEQSLYGKVIGKVCALALRHKKPVIVVCGQSDLDEFQIKNLGIEKVIRLARNSAELAVALAQTRETIIQRIQTDWHQVIQNTDNKANTEN